MIESEAKVLAPTEYLRFLRTEVPEPAMADKHLRYDKLLDTAQSLPRIRIGVVHPYSRKLAGECGFDLAAFSIVDAQPKRSKWPEPTKSMR